MLGEVADGVADFVIADISITSSQTSASATTSCPASTGTCHPLTDSDPVVTAKLFVEEESL